MSEVGNRLSDLLWDARKKLGVSQSEIGRRMGASSSYICQLEQGKINEPALSNLILIASAYQLRLIDVMIAMHGNRILELLEGQIPTGPVALEIRDARLRSQCFLCLGIIEPGDPIAKAGDDLLATGHGVWVHLPCGDAWAGAHSDHPALINQSWEILQVTQQCADCRVNIPHGSKAFRVLNPNMKYYDRICQLCWMKRILSG